MQNHFFVSGFLYHQPTQQVLLQQLPADSAGNFVFFRQKSTDGAAPSSVFRQCLEDALGITIKEDSVQPVYDYVHKRLGDYYVFYVKVAHAKPHTSTSGHTLSWVPLARASKYPMSEQTRHDLVIAERVMRSLLPADTPSRH